MSSRTRYTWHNQPPAQYEDWSTTFTYLAYQVLSGDEEWLVDMWTQALKKRKSQSRDDALLFCADVLKDNVEESFPEEEQNRLYTTLMHELLVDFINWNEITAELFAIFPFNPLAVMQEGEESV